MIKAVPDPESTDSDGNIVTFYWSPRADWQAIEVSATAGRQTRPGLASWQLPRRGLDGGQLLVEKLAGISAGAATVFSWSSAHDWSALDVSAFTGIRFTTTPASWHASCWTGPWCGISGT